MRKIYILIIGLLVLFTSSLILSAYDYGEQPLAAQDEIKFDPTTQDYVDNNSSDIDSGGSQGSHSNFTDMQLADFVYDTLTEEKVEWSHFKYITIDHTKVDGDLTNFPVLISIYDSDIKSKAQTDGDDIAFFDSYGNHLDHEIEVYDNAYNSTHAQLIAWVKCNLTSSIDTIMTMYYGNSTMNNQENPTVVWSNSFRAVWHMSETPTSDPYLVDSTTNKNNGTFETAGTAWTSSDQVSGIINGAINPHTTNDKYILVTNDATLNFGSNVEFTISFWLNDSDSSTFQTKFRKRGTSGYICYYQSGSDLFWRIDEGTTTTDISSSGHPMDGQWHLIHVGRNSTHSFIYIDGKENATISDNTLADLTSTEDLAIMGETGYAAATCNGTMDELRFAGVARSLNWIVTEYNNQFDPNSFYSVGAEQSNVEWNNWSLELVTNGGFEDGDFNGWTTVGANWSVSSNPPYGTAGPQSGSFCAWNNDSDMSNYIYQDVDVTAYASYIDEGHAVINASGWYVSSEYDPTPFDVSRVQIIFLDSSYSTISTPLDTGYDNTQTWKQGAISNYPVPANTRYIRLWANTYESGWDSGSLDGFSVKIRTEEAPYKLDLEVQWTNADYDEANEELCIYVGTTAAENILVDVWDGSQWQNVFSDLSATSWNNVSVNAYLTGPMFTIRFRGGLDTSDANQDSWQIDTVLLLTWTDDGNGGGSSDSEGSGSSDGGGGGGSGSSKSSCLLNFLNNYYGAKPNETITLSGTINSNEDGQLITINFEGKEYKTYTFNNGSFEFTLKAPSAYGIYTASAKFAGDPDWKSANTTCKVLVIEEETQMTIDLKENLEKDEQVTIKVILTKENGDPVTGDQVTFYIYERENTITTNFFSETACVRAFSLDTSELNLIEVFELTTNEHGNVVTEWTVSTDNDIIIVAEYPGKVEGEGGKNLGPSTVVYIEGEPRAISIFTLNEVWYLIGGVLATVVAIGIFAMKKPDILSVIVLRVQNRRHVVLAPTFIDPTQYGIKAIFLVVFDPIIGPVIKEGRIFDFQMEFSHDLFDPAKLTLFYTMSSTKDQFKLEEVDESIFVKAATTLIINEVNLTVAGEIVAPNLLVVVTKKDCNEKFVWEFIKTVLVGWSDQQGYLVHQMDRLSSNNMLEIGAFSLL